MPAWLLAVFLLWFHAVLYKAGNHLPRNAFSVSTRIFHELLSRDHEDGCATGQPSRGTAGLVPRRTWTVRRRGRHPRTPGRTAISVVAVTPRRDEISGLVTLPLFLTISFCWPSKLFYAKIRSLSTDLRGCSPGFPIRFEDEYAGYPNYTIAILMLFLYISVKFLCKNFVLVRQWKLKPK